MRFMKNFLLVGIGLLNLSAVCLANEANDALQMFKNPSTKQEGSRKLDQLGAQALPEFRRNGAVDDK